MCFSHWVQMHPSCIVHSGNHICCWRACRFAFIACWMISTPAALCVRMPMANHAMCDGNMHALQPYVYHVLYTITSQLALRAWLAASVRRCLPAPLPVGCSRDQLPCARLCRLAH